MQARALALYYSAVRSTTDNIRERHTSLTLSAKGSILNDEQIVLAGQAPRVGRNCRPDGSYTSNLEFRRLKPNDAAQSQEASAGAAPDPKATSIPTGQVPVTNETVGAKDLRYYLLGAGLIVMTVWLLIVLFCKRFIRRIG